MRLLAALIIAVVATQSQPALVRSGLAAASGGTAVLAMEGPALAVGTSVTLVNIDEPQQAWRARIVRPLTESPAMARHETRGPYYEIAADPGQSTLPTLAVATLGRPQVERAGSAVRLHLDNPRLDIRVRGCASSEGLHLTLWAGEPLKSQRLWHAYYYLGYDVEPTCQPGDVRQDRQPQ